MLGAATLAGVVESATVITRMVRKLAAIIRARGIDVVDAQHITASVFGLMAGKWTGTPTTVTEYHTATPGAAGHAARGQVRAADARGADLRLADAPRRDQRVAHRRPPAGRGDPNGVPRPVPTRPAEEARASSSCRTRQGRRLVAQAEPAGAVQGPQPPAQGRPAGARRGAPTRTSCSWASRAKTRRTRPRSKPRRRRWESAIGCASGAIPGPGDARPQLVEVHAHVLVFDSLPIAITEGMALARPAVVTRVGGIPEMVTTSARASWSELQTRSRSPTGSCGCSVSRRPPGGSGEAALARYEHGYRPEVMARSLEALFTSLCRGASAQPLAGPGTSRG